MSEKPKKPAPTSDSLDAKSTVDNLADELNTQTTGNPEKTHSLSSDSPNTNSPVIEAADLQNPDTLVAKEDAVKENAVKENTAKEETPGPSPETSLKLEATHKIKDAADPIKAKPQDLQKPESTKRTAESQPAKSPSFAKKKALWLLILLILIGWGVTAAGGYWVYLQYLASQQNTTRLQNQLGDLNQQVEQALTQTKSENTLKLEQFKQGVNTELKAIEREASGDLSQLASQIKEHEARLNGQQQRLANLSTTSREDWLLAEAQYLLKLANQRVLLERTPQNVVALLTRADEIIERVSAGLGDRELFSIRKLLAEEITALKMVEPVDTQGIYLKLGALANTIHSLPTLPSEQERFGQVAMEPKEEPSANKEPSANNNKEPSAKKEPSAQANESFIAEFKREMSSLFLFIRNAFSWYSEDELANPIVSQQRLQLMQLNTRLLIEQAQIAILKENVVSYRESLKAASELAGQYYFASPARTALINELDHLAQKNIAPELPNISQSLKLLHTYIATQHRLNTPSAGQLRDKGAAQ